MPLIEFASAVVVGENPAVCTLDCPRSGNENAPADREFGWGGARARLTPAAGRGAVVTGGQGRGIARRHRPPGGLKSESTVGMRPQTAGMAGGGAVLAGLIADGGVPAPPAPPAA
ncbi:hypothetical protein DRB89_33875 [Streptomyces sp. ICC4]|nr:hypothetical protein DRB89_33875 [Streptomyces sp. ICC4]